MTESTSNANSPISENLNSSSKITCEFLWEAEPKEWGGFNEVDLLDLVDETADFMGISPENKKRTTVYFGDQIGITGLDGKEIRPMAAAYATYDIEQSEPYPIKNCTVLLNRSLELACKNLGISPKDYWCSSAEFFIEGGIIVCYTKSPWEAVVWTLAEELQHASVFFKNQTVAKTTAAKEKYLKFAKSKMGNITRVNPYTYNLLEVAAARQSMRFLEIQAQKRNEPERADFFRAMYIMSLETGMSVIPNFSQIYKGFYFETGYKPRLNYPTE